MKMHLALPVSAMAVTLVLGGCSSGDSGSTESSSSASESSSTGSSSSAAAAPGPELQKAADEYKAYAVAQSEEASVAL